MQTHPNVIQGNPNQELEASQPRPLNAATRNVDLMAFEMQLYGEVSDELWAMVQDEEATHAAELLAAQEMAYATVPRTFRLEGNDLVDKHNQRLKKVLQGGIKNIQDQQDKGVPGASWELRRRLAESVNVDKIIGLGPGMACVEISASPFDKPENERKAQHYTDLTMIRASFMGHDNLVQQYNYVLPVSSIELLKAIQTKLGRSSEEHILSSEELLENPIIQPADEPVETAIRELDNLIGAALLEVSVGESAVRMIKKAIENRKEAWQFINSESNDNLHNELKAVMVQAAELPPAQRQRAIEAIRSGFWKELKDRFSERKVLMQEGGIIMAAAERAVADGDVFIACGSTVTATSFSGEGSGLIGRAGVVKSLRENIIGNGACSGCGAKGKLYGCGLCSSCNKKWCDIYEATGKQTEIKELAYRNYGRPGAGIFEIRTETFSEYWQRIGEEIRQKHQLRKTKLT
jgi:hypothetical protein